MLPADIQGHIIGISPTQATQFAVKERLPASFGQLLRCLIGCFNLPAHR